MFLNIKSVLPRMLYFDLTKNAGQMLDHDVVISEWNGFNPFSNMIYSKWRPEENPLDHSGRYVTSFYLFPITRNIINDIPVVVHLYYELSFINPYGGTHGILKSKTIKNFYDSSEPVMIYRPMLAFQGEISPDRYSSMTFSAYIIGESQCYFESWTYFSAHIINPEITFKYKMEQRVMGFSKPR